MTYPRAGNAANRWSESTSGGGTTCTTTTWVHARGEDQKGPPMSDRDRIARVVALELVRQAREASDYQNRDCYKVADALIAAGVTMPAPQIGCQAGPVGHEGECW